MEKDNVVQFTSRLESEIALAERAYDLILERMARGRLSKDIPPGGDIPELLDAVGELLHLDALEADGRRIPEKKMQKTVTRLESAVYRLGDWPDVPRLLAMAPLIVALEELEIPWLATELMSLLPDIPPEAEVESADVRAAIGRVALVHLRLALQNEYWDESFEAPLRLLREEVIANPDDEEMELTLRQAVVFHAINGRITLLEAKRKKMTEVEPLPDDLIAALDDFESDVTEIKMVRWGLHLVLADVLAAGLAPEETKPEHLVAATEAAIIREDDPDIDVDLMMLARWARLEPKKLRALRDTVAAALDWAPDGFEGSMEGRQEKRWRLDTGSTDLWPPRWTPAETEKDLPPYTTKAARERVEELREVAWMVIDGLEALQFVTGVFRFGGDAPDEIELEIVSELIEVWKTERIIDFDQGPGRHDDGDGLDEEDLDDDWDDLDPDDIDGGSIFTTSDGEPMVFCTGEYEFRVGDRSEVIKRLDAIPQLQREQEDGGERWVWLEKRNEKDLVIGSIEIEGRKLLAESMSVKRSDRIGAELAAHLGDLTILIALITEPATPAMLAERAADDPGDEGAHDLSPSEVRETVQRMMEQHYREWADDEIPELDGMTPREAVKSRKGRKQVTALLHDFEEWQESASEDMRRFDFGFLWRDLGLDRETES